MREVAFQRGNAYSHDHPFGACGNAHPVRSIGRHHNGMTFRRRILTPAAQNQARSLYRGLDKEIGPGLVRLDVYGSAVLDTEEADVFFANSVEFDIQQIAVREHGYSVRVDELRDLLVGLVEPRGLE